MSIETGNPAETWNQFWLPLFLENPGEEVQIQVMKELHDYRWMIINWSEALCELTGGKLGKPNYPARTIIDSVTDYFGIKNVITTPLPNGEIARVVETKKKPDVPYGHTDGSMANMSLRDYFAGQALVSLAASASGELANDDQPSAQETALQCYVIADAMLKARKA